MNLKQFVRTAALSLAVLAPLTSSAQTTQIATRAGMTGSVLNWVTVYGPVGTNVLNTPTATGVGGLTVAASNPSSVGVLAQGNGWSGGFLPGESVLFGSAGVGTLSLLFNNDIFGFGANVQANVFGTFVGTVKAFDLNDVLLGQFSVNGVSVSAGDGSEPFLGIRSTTGIRRITYEVSGPSDQSLGINQATIETTGSPNVVPEPGTYMLVAAGLAGLAVVRRNRRA